MKTKKPLIKQKIAVQNPIFTFEMVEDGLLSLNKHDHNQEEIALLLNLLGFKINSKGVNQNAFYQIAETLLEQASKENEQQFRDLVQFFIDSDNWKHRPVMLLVVSNIWKRTTPC